MIVDIEKDTECGAFDLPGGGKVTLRLLSPDDLSDMRKACTKKTVEYPLLGDGDKADYRRFEAIEFDDDLFFEMTVDRTIVTWTGLVDRNKKPIEPTKENKILLSIKSDIFAKAYQSGMASLKKSEAKRKKESEKNLKTLPSGRPA